MFFHLHCHLPRPRYLPLLLVFHLVSLLCSCPPTIPSLCFSHLQAFAIYCCLCLGCSLPASSRWLLLVHLKHHFLRSEHLLTSWSKVTLLFCLPPIISYSIYLLLFSWNLPNLTDFYLFASILVAVSLIRISLPWGREPGLLSLLPYLGFSAQLVTHSIERMTLFLGLFTQSTSTVPTMELDIGNQEGGNKTLPSRSSEWRRAWPFIFWCIVWSFVLHILFFYH